MAIIRSQSITVENKDGKDIEDIKQEKQKEVEAETETRDKLMFGNCEVDTRVKLCDIDNVCPDMSECVDGVCCKQPPLARCGNGLMALTIPSTCELSDDCPISSRCEYGKCCPLLTDPQDQEEESTVPPSQEIKQDITSTTTKILKKTKKPEKTGGMSINKTVSSVKFHKEVEHLRSRNAFLLSHATFTICALLISRALSLGSAADSESDVRMELFRKLPANQPMPMTRVPRHLTDALSLATHTSPAATLQDHSLSRAV